MLNDFAFFPGITKVAAIASPPEMLRLATAERKVIHMHCLEDKLCVWRPLPITELSYNLVMIGHPVWSGRARHSYGHLLFTDIEEGTYQIEQLQITNSEVIPHGIRCEGLLRVLSWISFACCYRLREGCNSLHMVPIEGRAEMTRLRMSRACSEY